MEGIIGIPASRLSLSTGTDVSLDDSPSSLITDFGIMDTHILQLALSVTLFVSLPAELTSTFGSTLTLSAKDVDTGACALAFIIKGPSHLQPCRPGAMPLPLAFAVCC